MPISDVAASSIAGPAKTSPSLATGASSTTQPGSASGSASRTREGDLLVTSSRLRVCGVGAALAVLACLVGAQAGLTQQEDPGDVCGPPKRGEHCGPGNGRQTPGGGDKVSHKGW